jgi:phosphatidyl-myo-inositol dimannoside synthase
MSIGQPAHGSEMQTAVRDNPIKEHATARNSLDLLLVTWNFPPKTGGMENLIHDLYHHLKCELRIEVIAPKGADAEHQSQVHRPRYPGFAFFVLFSTVRGMKLIRSRSPHVVLGGSLVVTPLLALFKVCFGIRAIAYAHGLDVLYSGRFYQAILRFCIRALDGIICNSDKTRVMLLAHFSATRTKPIQVISPGVDSSRFAEILHRRHPRKYLLSVGRLTERKGLVPFIEQCFAQIAREFPDVDLLIAGDEPKDAVFHKTGYAGKISACVEKLALGDRVRLLGWVSDKTLVSLYQHCEALVFPLTAVPDDIEGFGMVAIEAAAAGRPTIAFDEGGIGNAVIQGLTGLLVNPGDYAAFCRRIEEVLNGKRPFPLIRQAAREKFDWQSRISAYSEFLLPR